MNIQQAITRVVNREHLSTEEMISVTRQIMTGEASPAQIGGFLVALRMKSETVDEITGAAMVMRELATKVVIDAPNMVDTCGTGGDEARLFNVSTASAFVVAAAGGHVAKHGNRSVTSSTGSADLLEAAGINLEISPEQVARCIREVGVGFMFAVSHHGAMKHAIGPRKELGLRTVFNILGPITNPADVKRQVIGVFNKNLCAPMAEVLERLGSDHVMVVCSREGLDEFSLAGPTHVAELKGGEIREYEISPEELDLEVQTLKGLAVEGPEQSLELIEDALGKRRGPFGQKAADMIALNAGAAIYVSGIAASFADGVAMAQDAIGSGLALGKLAELREFTACFA
ncbi:anthranilate phosphoribosyltransferase [Gilvimarinus sp. F26214L]|uniref:anthranilate phosphoribosyltransferase n=1 Tax=Gilvimarinus sp. DZF01 TaxID=3461371 RepID=UPI004045F3FE